jgi:hypothetical protein
MDELVGKLSIGDHPVELTLRPEQSAKALQQQIGYGHVFVKFMDTRGGTELRVPLDQSATDLTRAYLANGAGSARFVGELTLNNVKVRCIADVDLGTYTGTGRLQPVIDTVTPS